MTTDPLEVTATILYQPYADGPVEGQFRLSGETIRFRNDDLDMTLDLSSVFDVRVGSPPKAARNVFSGKILIIGFDQSETREVIFLKFDKPILKTIADLLYRRLLDGAEVAVSHPSKVGGRVTSKSYEIGKLVVSPGKFGCLNINRPVSVNLESIIDFSRSTETLLDERQQVITIQYVQQGIAISLKLSLPQSRRHHLLGRFLRREHNETKEKLERIDLPKAASQALVKLYSLRGTAKPQSLFKSASEPAAAVLRGLVKADLVEINDEQATLTSRGWILVAEHSKKNDGRLIVSGPESQNVA